MAPQGQGLKWSEVICCPFCVKVFSRHKQAVNLSCSHAVCTDCIRHRMDDEHFCLTDKISGELPLSILPKNKAMMSIVGIDVTGLEAFIQYDDSLGPTDLLMMQNIDESLCGMASYLRPIETDRGGSLWSEVMSRTVQRKIVHLLCLQLAEPSGRLRAARQSRLLAERILCELMMAAQNHQSLSHQLWTAVRARGCQFLGPAMQDDILNLILLTMSHNALIARKTLVMYVVKRMADTYPQVSKTCVGHVVQLLYRASCFNVLKREGESSLMQLKEEFTSMDALRKEHDAQIVSIATEAGLRIAPEQWSGLLYGDYEHRSHMQSILDKLMTSSSFSNGIEDLRRMSEGDGLMEDTVESLRAVDELTTSISEGSPDCSISTVDWRPLRKILEALRELVEKYAEVLTRRNQARADYLQQAVAEGTEQQSIRPLIRPIVPSTGTDRPFVDTTPPHVPLTLFKTKLCRDFPHCARGDRCSYAHDEQELRVPGGGNGERRRRETRRDTPTASRWPFVQSVPASVPPPVYPPPQQMGQTVVSAPMMHPYPPPQPQQMMVQQSGGAPAPVMMMQQSMMGGMQQQPTMHWQPQPLQPPPHVSWLPTSEMDSQTGVYWGPMPMKNMTLSGPSELSEMEQLHMRRDEIISRLGPLSLEQDDMFNGPSTSGGDNDDAHVAYTVASSVLDDRISDLMQANASSVNPIIELPPMPPGYTPVINSTTTSEETLGVLSEMALGDAAGAASNASVKARTSSLTTTTTTVRTACPAYAFSTTVDGCTTATVQADCSTMHVRDTISEPVATPVIVPSYSVVLYAPAAEGAPGAVMAANGALVAPNGSVLAPAPAPGASFETTPESLTRDAARLPMVIQPLSQINPVQAEDPQDIVSNTLDRIVDVREKLTEVDGAASTVVKTQLEVELEIASRQIEQLDPLTTQNCLLKELEAVERKIEEIESCTSNEQQLQQPVPQQMTAYHYPQVMPMTMHGMQ